MPHVKCNIWEMTTTLASLVHYTMFSPMMGCLHIRWWNKGTIWWIVGTWYVAIRSTIVCWCEVGHLIRINNWKEVRHSLFGTHRGPIKSQTNCQWKIKNGDAHLPPYMSNGHLRTTLEPFVMELTNLSHAHWFDAQKCCHTNNTYIQPRKMLWH